MDYRSCGRPDVSYHGEYVWRPEFENFRRQLGILYWGEYGTKEDGSQDDTIPRARPGMCFTIRQRARKRACTERLRRRS